LELGNSGQKCLDTFSEIFCAVIGACSYLGAAASYFLTGKSFELAKNGAKFKLVQV